MMELLDHGVFMNPAIINPEVISPQDEVEELVKGYLSREKLAKLTRTDDLESVQYLEMKVDSRKTSLSMLGKLLPSMCQLKLSNSYIPSLRDIGSGFDHLTVLWMPRCELSDIDGMCNMTHLQELYLAHNDIADLSSLSMLEELTVLDLEGNCVSDWDQIDYLALCPELLQLTIKGNPIGDDYKIVEGDTDSDGRSSAQDAGKKAKRKVKSSAFRRRIVSIIPRLRILDDQSVSKCDREAMDPAAADTETKGIPSAPTGRPSVSRRPQSATGKRSTPGWAIDDSSSGLTHGTGQIMAGNPILFLRSRRTTASTTAKPTYLKKEPSEPVSRAAEYVPHGSPTHPSPSSFSPVVGYSPPPPTTSRPTSSFTTPHPPSTPPAHMSPRPPPPQIARPATADPSASTSLRFRRIRSVSTSESPGQTARPPDTPPHTGRDSKMGSARGQRHLPTKEKDIAFYAKTSTDLARTTRSLGMAKPEP